MTSRLFSVRAAFAVAALLAVLGLGLGCGSPAIPPRTAYQLSTVDGVTRSGVVGQPLAAPYVVRVTDSAGRAVSGVTVTWAVQAGGGSISPASSVSDEKGEASATATLGQKSGPGQAFAASVDGLRDSPVVFKATAKPAAAAQLAAVSGDLQETIAGRALPAPFVVKATDAFGNSVSGATVSWSAVFTGATVSAATTKTAADGTAQVSATLGGPNKGGPQTFQAKLDAGTPVTFTANALPSGLVYVDPNADKKVALIKDEAASDWNVLVLKLVTRTPMSAFSAGMNLPLGEGISLAATDGFTPGTALELGTAPQAVAATIPPRGSLKGVLVSGISQKANSTPADKALPAGTTLYTLKLVLSAGAAHRKVFDGAALPAAFWAALRDRAGNDVAAPTDFAVGSLEIR